MARSAESCIFCAPDPCACNQVKPKARKANSGAAVGRSSKDRANATVLQGDSGGDATLGATHVVGGLGVDEASQGIQETIQADASKSRPGLSGARLATPAGTTVRSPDRRTGLASVPAARPVGHEDYEYRRALTVLCESGLICADDILKHKDDLLLTESEKRQLIWRQKRVENGIRLAADAAG